MNICQKQFFLNVQQVIVFINFISGVQKNSELEIYGSQKKLRNSSAP